MSKGIDYGRGLSNIDRETGIRFGVIPVHALKEWVWESFEADYGAPTCPKCGNDAVEWDGEKHDDYAQTKWGCDDFACESCQHTYDSHEVYGDEPLSHDCTDEDYSATIGSDCVDVFILRSPYFTRAAYCSPCAPGACYLTSPCDDGERTYCFGHDWFDGGEAPYPVYSVATGEQVHPDPE